MNTWQGTAGAVLAALVPFALKQHNAHTYRCNLPLRAGSNSHVFTLTLHDDEHGTWYDHVSGEAGSLYNLAEKLGIQRDIHPAPTSGTKRAYTGLADYAQAHGVPAKIFRAADWREGASSCSTHQRKRSALLFETANGTRARFIDGLKPTYTSPKGYAACWYRLRQALVLASDTAQPVTICNGEASTVVAQHYGVAACAVGCVVAE